MIKTIEIYLLIFIARASDIFLNSIYFMLIDASTIFPHHMSFVSFIRNRI